MTENIKTIKSPYLYLHGGIHLILILIITEFKSSFIIPSIILVLAHLIIDVITKIALKDSFNSLQILILDQCLHILSIAIYVKYFFPYTMNYHWIFNTQHYLILLCFISLTVVSSILIRKIIETLQYEIPNNGLPNAGKYIGMLERIFVFIFVISCFWKGIGFLLAAKSIFRFGDLKENRDIKLTEYILIGTLLSFGLAILMGKIYLYSIQQL